MNDRWVASDQEAMPASPGTVRSNKHAIRLALYIALMILDGVALIVAAGFAGRIRGAEWLAPGGIGLGIAIVPLYELMAFKGQAFSMRALRNVGESVRSSLSALGTTMMVLLFFTFFGQLGDEISRVAFLIAMAGSAVLITLGRYLFHILVVSQRIDDLLDEVLVIDGVHTPYSPTARILDAAALNLRPDLRDPVMLGRLADYFADADRVVIASVQDRQHDWSLLLKGMNIIGEIVLLEGNSIGAIGVNRFNGQHTVVVSRGPLDISNRAKKRTVDIAFAVAALIALSPLLILVAIAIKLESPGPVFFRQKRVGRDNRLFDILKFRSMKVETCDANGNRSTSRDDDRITRVGKFIRSTSIDELPQLINVLNGDMSVVGPRPHALGSLAGDQLFWEVTERYWLRHSLKPGMTGLAQVRGLRGATNAKEDLERRLQADLEYINDWQLWRDFVIVFRTVKVLVHSQAY